MNSKNALLFSVLTISLISCFTAFKPAYAKEKTAPRWFEIEVIIFNQLNDKEVFNETFPQYKPLPKYERAYELLNSFVQPNISSRKQLLSSCDPDIFNHSLTAMLQDSISPSPSLSFMDSNPLAVNLLTSETTVNETILLESPIASPLENQNTIEDNNSLSGLAEGTLINEQIVLSAKERALVIDAQNKLSETKWDAFVQYPSFPNKQLCSIPKNYFKTTLKVDQYKNFAIDGLPIKRFTGVVDAIEKPKSDTTPYLISKSSLRLTDISQKLRGSRSFKPLLHFGWRQIGLTRKKSIPLKVFAGDNFDLAYQDALAKNEAQKQLIDANQAIEIEHAQQGLSQTVREQSLAQNNNLYIIDDSTEKLASGNKTNEMVTFDEALSEKAKLEQLHIQKILSQLPELDTTNVEDIIAQLGKQQFFSSDMIDENSLDTTPLTPIQNIEPPIQPWFLDGFIRVHLDHYLYINADINILNQNLQSSQQVDDEGQAITELKAINFSQNRRVISGEVHYFDHPYIGMIIQIRRFDPTKPEGEGVSQAVR
jgi:hypothetical protein